MLRSWKVSNFLKTLYMFYANIFNYIDFVCGLLIRFGIGD
uniref:Uncharacterized protein n=1 Tax=Rhizophora mucronata TaxID=61149 RepID=A0A2P2JFH6_RHIMU